METRRLKNIAILILLLVNIFLLLLLGYQYLQSRWAEADAAQQLRDLFAVDHLALSRQVDLSQPTPPVLTLSRQKEEETNIASYLLDGSITSSSQGGGIYSYTSSVGSIQFRSNGGFDGTALSNSVEDPESFSNEFCQRFGYRVKSSHIDQGSGSIVAVQYMQDIPVEECTVTFTFSDSILTSVSGTHLSLTGATTSPGDPLTCTTALVRFLDYWRSSGVVCREVTAMRCLYQSESTSSALRLVPIWQVETDTYIYSVNSETGAVFRQ